MKRVLWILVAGIVLALSRVSFAAEIDMLVNKLAEKNLITYGEAQQIMTESKEAMRKDLAAGKVETMPLWIQNISFKGDLRIRYQDDFAQGSTDRQRLRMRLRAGAETRIIEGFKVGFGLATGKEGTVVSSTSTSPVEVYDMEPRSDNYTFSRNFSKPTIFVDYGFVEYSPVSWAKVTLGKFKNPIFTAVDSFLWKSDLNPDGAYANFTYDVNPNVNLFLTPGFFILDEVSAGTQDPTMSLLQPGCGWKINNSLDLKAAVGLEYFHVKGYALPYSSGGTNTMISSKYAYNYICTVPSLVITYKEVVGTYGVSLFGDYTVNSDTDTENTGYSIGIRFGDEKVAERGQWQLKYMYESLGRDSFLDTIVHSDVYGGKTNVVGNRVCFELGLSKTVSFVSNYFGFDVIKGASSPKSLIQTDIVARF